MKSSQAFVSEYLKSNDVSGQGENYTIKKITMVEFADGEKKPAVWFEEITKGLILNRTNWNRIAKLLGEESDNWPGHKIALKLEAVDYMGNSFDAIRITSPAGAPVEKEEVPF